MIAHRSAHYWIWFVLLGVVSVIVSWTTTHGFNSETIWLFGGGLLGVLTGSSLLGGRLARTYDVTIGLIFTLIGLLGVLHNMGVDLVAVNDNLLGRTINSTAILGLSTALPYTLIHTLLGVMSLNQGVHASALPIGVKVHGA